MTVDRWLNCPLDPEGLQLLQQWKDSLLEAEQEAIALEADLDAALADITSASTVKASLELGSLATTNRMILTAATDDPIIDQYSIFIYKSANYSSPHVSSLSIKPSSFAGPLTDPIEIALREARTILVELDTDDQGNVFTTPQSLAVDFTAAGYDALFTAETPDAITPMTAPDGPKTFSGRKGKSLEDVLKGLDDLYKGTGKDHESILEVLGIPVAKAEQSAAEVLSQVSDTIVLASGTKVQNTGDNLIALRQAWDLLNESTSQLVELITNTQDGYPIVIWTKEVTTTTEVDICDGGGTRTETSIVLDTVNGKPVAENASPWVFWVNEIVPSVTSLNLLTVRYGLNETQLETALAEGDTTFTVLNESGLLAAFGLTSSSSLSTADLGELLALRDVEGFGPLSTEAMLADLTNTPADASNGFVSAAFNLPGGQDLEDALSPEKSQAADIQDMNDNNCLSIPGKAALNSLLAAVSSTIDMITRVVERIRGKVVGVLNKASTILSNIQNVLGNLPAIGCLLGEDISIKGPQIDFLLPTIELFSISIEVVITSVDAIIESIFPKICGVSEALKDLLGTGIEEVDCLLSGLTNAIANAVGQAIGKALDAATNLIPCIENPFDLTGMLTVTLDKVESLQGLIVSMLNDLRAIQAQFNSLGADISGQGSTDNALNNCNDEFLSALVSTIKEKFGI